MRYMKVAVSAIAGGVVGLVAAILLFSPVESFLRDAHGVPPVTVLEWGGFAMLAAGLIGAFAFLRASIRHNCEGERAMVPRYLIAFVSGVIAWWFGFIIVATFATAFTDADEGPFTLYFNPLARAWLELSAAIVALGSAWLTLRCFRWRDEGKSAAASP